MPFSKDQYIKSLEHRVVELKSILSAQGISELSSDHWKAFSPSPPTPTVHLGSEYEVGCPEDGLALVYCIWISPDEIFNITTSNGIYDCSIILFVITERLQAAKKHRNAFEVICQRVIDRMSEAPVRKPRDAISGLMAELVPSVNSFEIDMPFEVDNESVFSSVRSFQT
ncbi:hypothetical protein B0T14DRAFT_570656 [Immersiella caudata]|uniref:Uncharacterized protein n=1 Tax=Immersiella caudata TaxID=314043 RepID=A0AA39WG24_9PEZI|nr:hypothetical protein B0T14DRAFT_570656 [Immersiella caudata]